MSGTILFFGSSGIALATAKAMASKGYKIHFAGRDRAKLDQAASAMGGAGVSVVDVTDPASIETAVLEAASLAGGTLAGLCYAAGTINLKPVARLSDTDVMQDFRINAAGAFHAVKAALPALKSYDGIASVLLFSTVAVQQGFALHASVAMAKGAVEGLTRSLAAELAPKIRVNAIAPSLTRTPLAASLTANETMANAIAGLHPLQRLGEADDLAPLAALLLSGEGGWITGQVMGVDGGRSSLRIKG